MGGNAGRAKGIMCYRFFGSGHGRARLKQMQFIK
jgi:hypothetical protein